MVIVTPDEEPEPFLDFEGALSRHWAVGTTYKDFVEQEDIPIHGGYAIEDVSTVAVDDWERTGGKGAFIQLLGHEGLNDFHVHEIPPGESLNPLSPIYEEWVYVVSGNGATKIEDRETGEEYTFEWSENSTFFLPRNISYQHINLGEEPARIIADTDLPVLFRQFRDEGFIYDDDYTFQSPRSGDFSDGGTQVGSTVSAPVIWNTSFIPDFTAFENLDEYQLRGGKNVKFQWSYARSLLGHGQEFEPGKYQLAHRHTGGSSILIVRGEGYSLLWSEKDPDEKIRIDWKPGTLLPPPTHWFHQHFPLSEDPRPLCLAMYAPHVVPQGPEKLFTPRSPDNRIQFVDEDPEIRELYEQELKKQGLESRMPEECYTDPDHPLNLSMSEAKEKFGNEYDQGEYKDVELDDD